jgi:hypothetical protein
VTRFAIAVLLTDVRRDCESFRTSPGMKLLAVSIGRARALSCSTDPLQAAGFQEGG